MQYPTISEYIKASQDASDNLDMSTEATDEELNEAITDEFGVKYSKDGRKLLKVPYELNGTYSMFVEILEKSPNFEDRGGECSPPLILYMEKEKQRRLS